MPSLRSTASAIQAPATCSRWESLDQERTTRNPVSTANRAATITKTARGNLFMIAAAYFTRLWMENLLHEKDKRKKPPFTIAGMCGRVNDGFASRRRSNESLRRSICDDELAVIRDQMSHERERA